jgi:hypothetical protein
MTFVSLGKTSRLFGMEFAWSTLDNCGLLGCSEGAASRDEAVVDDSSLNLSLSLSLSSFLILTFVDFGLDPFLSEFSRLILSPSFAAAS